MAFVFDDDPKQCIAICHTSSKFVTIVKTRPAISPSIMYERQEYMKYMTERLSNKRTSKQLEKVPICLALADQRYFAGVGNYLRAEIMARLGIKPFDAALPILKERLQEIANEICKVNNCYKYYLIILMRIVFSAGPADRR